MHSYFVIDKPEVLSHISSPFRVIEGQTAKSKCLVTAANPNNSIIWIWFNADNPYFVLPIGSTYTISNIKRTRSGSYNCTASNSVGTFLAVKVDVDVLCK